MEKYFENGRSMVEMLGTLAIIGVLSVGAIAGYSYGMDKYRANETINDVMLLGVDVITQASRTAGMPNLSAEWGTKTTVGYHFTVVPNPEDETQYGIQIDGVPARVCKMVGDALKPMASVYVNDDEHITEEDPCDESDNNTMEFYFETGAVESDGCKTDTDCGLNQYCDTETGICLMGDKPVGTYGFKNCTTDNDCGECGGTCSDNICILTKTKNGKSCTIETVGDGVCHWGDCVLKGCTYEENKCQSGYYCASPNTSASNAFPSNSTGQCVKPTFTKHEIAGKTYYISYYNLSWWDAEAACKAIGRDGLITVSDLYIEATTPDWKRPRTPLADGLDKLLNGINGTRSTIWATEEYNSSSAYAVELIDGYDHLTAYDKNTVGLSFFTVCR